MYISIEQAITVWEDLLQAYEGRHRYGSTTAEIYAYKLIPNSPAYNAQGTLSEGAKEIEEKAWQSLICLLNLFKEKHKDCAIQVEDIPLEQVSFTGGRFIHRVHVSIVKDSI